jgi:hypothetical protein
MATYGSNSLAVRFNRELVEEPQTKSTEMPPASPMQGGYMPGGKQTPLPGRKYPKGMKNQPWKSWLQDNKRPGIKRKKKTQQSCGVNGVMI